ncbi:MAG: hypothetical protein KA436_03695 [Oligoflexales bacterium]|nr:hypothetical protein [Oligoflexales bacterium]
MFKKIITRLILAWSGCFLLLVGAGSYFFYQGVKNYSENQSRSRLDQAEAFISFSIESEKFKIRSQLLKLIKNKLLVDYTDFGQVDMIKAHLDGQLVGLENIHYQVFDYEGDPLSTSVMMRKLDPDFAKKMVMKAVKGQNQEALIFVDGSLMLVSSGPIGFEKDPSGAIVLMQSLEGKISEDLITLVGVNVGFVYQGHALIAPQKKEVMQKFVQQLPRRGKNLFDGQIEDTSEGSLLRLVDLKSKISSQDVRWILVYPLSIFQSMARNFLLPFFLLSFLLFGLGLLLTFTNLWPFHKSWSDMLSQFDSFSHNILSSMRFSTSLSNKTGVMSKKINEMIDLFQKKIEDSKNEERKTQERLTRVYNLLAVDDITFKMFIDNVKHQRKMCEHYIELLTSTSPKDAEGWKSGKEHVSGILRLIHTIRSDAKLFGLVQIEGKAQEFEDRLMKIFQAEEFPAQSVVGELELSLQDITSEIDVYDNLRKKILNRDVDKVIISEVNNTQIVWLTTLMGRLLVAFRNPLVRPQDLTPILQELEHALASVGRVDIRQFVKRYDHMLATISEKSAKKIVPIKLRGDCLHIPVSLINSVHSMLLHCLKNSLEHGVESLIKRIKLKKKEEGQITLDMQRKGEFLEIVVQDDGKGISSEEIKEVALHKKLMTVEQWDLMAEEDRISLLFREGFSTGKKTLYEGRGMGLASVIHSAKSMGGRVEMISSSSVGSALKITLPYPSQRFLAPHTLFDLKSAVNLARLQVSAEMEKLGVILSVEDSLEEKYLAFTNRHLFFNTLLVFFRIIGVKAPNPMELKVSIQRIHLSSDHILSVGFAFKTEKTTEFILKLFQSEAFQDLLEKITEVPGFNFRIDTVNGTVCLDVLSNLPTELKMKKINIALLCQDTDPQVEFMKTYLKESLGNWPHEIFSEQKDISFLLNNHATESDVVTCVFLEDTSLLDAMEDKDGQTKNLSLRRDLHNLVLISQDISAMDSSLLGILSEKCGIEPSIMESPLDRFAIEEALESAIVRGLYS